jgi:hypothetical protein
VQLGFAGVCVVSVAIGGRCGLLPSFSIPLEDLGPSPSVSVCRRAELSVATLMLLVVDLVEGSLRARPSRYRWPAVNVVTQLILCGRVGIGRSFRRKLDPSMVSVSIATASSGVVNLLGGIVGLLPAWFDFPRENLSSVIRGATTATSTSFSS